MVFCMIIIGGLTRLTGSGLSMAEWRPLMGILPPVSDGEWERVFAIYQQTPEYLKVNLGMTLLEFKGIFWLEYIHRLWGRLTGLVFLLPLIVFWGRGHLSPRQKICLPVIFLLGAAQGLLGWYMVQSGLVERPDVSHYRLTSHLVLALVIYSALFLMAEAARPRPTGGLKRELPLSLRVNSVLALVLIALTMTYGGLVAGIDAGLAYNSFPLMGESLVPSGAFDRGLNVVDNVGTVQFIHRWLAIATLLVCLVLALRCRMAEPALRRTAGVLALVAIGQATLGILTLVFYVPLALASAHQAGGIILLTVALRVFYMVMFCGKKAPSLADVSHTDVSCDRTQDVSRARAHSAL